MNRTTPILCLVLLLGWGWLPAQETREIEFRVYAQYPLRGVEYPPVDESTIAKGTPPKAPVEIETHSLARTGPYSFIGTNQISFYAAGDGECVAQTTLPEGSDQWLLIFMKNPRYKQNPTKHLKYLIYPFDDSRRNLPQNGLVFLNISGKELDGLLENKHVKLSAGESGSYHIQESLPVNLWARGFDGKALLPALIKTYRFQPGHRYLMIFFPPVLRGSSDLDVRFLSEAVE